jgi:hypothetical protein
MNFYNLAKDGQGFRQKGFWSIQKTVITTGCANGIEAACLASLSSLRSVQWFFEVYGS